MKTFLNFGIQVKRSTLSKSADGNHTIMLLHFFDWKRSTLLLRIPGSRNWLGFP